MRHGVEQRRLQALALPQRLGVARALECLLKLAVEPLDLAAAGIGLLGTPLGAGPELAGRHRRDEEGEQGDPVVRVVDGHAPDRRQVEEVEADDAEQRGEHCRARPPPGRDEEANEE